MATTPATKKTTAKKSTSKTKKAEHIEDAKAVDITVEHVVEEMPASTNDAVKIEPIVEERKVRSFKDVDIHEYIPVRNGVHGMLIYVSPRTHEIFTWDEFGDELEMELQELKNAKSASKKFFVNNWFAFDEEYDWVIDYLGVRQFYKNALSVDNYDAFFSKTADEITTILGSMSDGQKRSIALRARQLVRNGDIDSNKVITALERGLGIDLIEK